MTTSTGGSAGATGGATASGGAPSGGAGAVGGSTAAGGSGAVGGSQGAGGASGGSQGGTGANGGGSAGSGNPARTDLLHVTFDGATPGVYTASAVAADFGVAPPWNDGLDEGRATIVEEDSNKFLRVTYPALQFGPGNGGVQFKVTLGSHEELFFSYRVRFGAGFEFVKGGKLPGLVGGTAPTGCSPDPDGFSARNMWRSGGAVVQYVYYPTQPNSCGDDLGYMRGGSAALFVPGTWHTVEHRIAMNTPGVADGVIEAWLDGELVLRDTARLWRNAGATFAIDTLYFSTFFGGSDSTWAPSTPQTVDFDDLIVADGPISHTP